MWCGVGLGVEGAEKIRCIKVRRERVRMGVTHSDPLPPDPVPGQVGLRSDVVKISW